MRRLLRVLPLLLLALACTKSTVSPGLRLDFVGSARFTSSTRTLSATPSDTLASKIYAVNTDTTVKLQRLLVRLTSLVTRTPVLYPASGVLPALSPDSALTYLDSALTRHPADLSFTNLLAGRTTSGVDLWQYSVSDANGRTANRAYRLVLRRPDSTAVVQTYRAYLSPVPYNYKSVNVTAALTPAQNSAFAYLGLREGLLLPHFSVTGKLAANRPLLDLVCLASGIDVRLAATVSSSLPNNGGWQMPAPRNKIELRSTASTSTDFTGFTTLAALTTAFAAGSSYAAGGGTFDGQVTDPLVKNTVIAFRLTEASTSIQRYGAILIADLVRTPTAIVTCQVVVGK